MTQVSQHWFLEKELILATGILAMSLPIGIVFGFGLTPLFVQDSEDIPLMNCVFFVPAAVSLIFSVLGMRSSKPKTPPSQSAALQQEDIPYIKRYFLFKINNNTHTHKEIVSLTSALLLELQHLPRQIFLAVRQGPTR